MKPTRQCLSFDPAKGVTLDAGESEAIAMSLEWPADLLIMDETSGRAMARNLNIRITEAAREILENGRAKSLVAVTLTKTRSNR
jgi:predicted nucleic acid-binding protein